MATKEERTATTPDSPTVRVSFRGVPYVRPEDILKSKVGQERLKAAEKIKEQLMEKRRDGHAKDSE